jgi:hypothetical protein
MGSRQSIFPAPLALLSAGVTFLSVAHPPLQDLGPFCSGQRLLTAQEFGPGSACLRDLLCPIEADLGTQVLPDPWTCLHSPLLEFGP